jgi:hypothetical protein
MTTTRRWRLHLGAHKTATTHIQRACAALDLDAGLLANDEATPLRIPDMRLRALPARLSPALRRREVLGRLSAMGRLRGHMILSNEDWIGHGEAGLEPGLYPRAGARVRSLVRGLARDGELEVFLSVRSPDTFLPSVYAQVLRFHPYPTDFAPIRERALARPPDWAGLVGRILRAAGDVPVRVWPYEAYRSNALSVLRAITGLPIDAVPEIEDPPETRTPSAEAVRRAEALSHVTAYAERIPAVARLYAETPGPKFMPFSEDESAALRDAYAAQLQVIRDRHPQAWLELG